MIDVVLIAPSGRNVIYQNLGDELTAIEPPAWVRMIGGWLRDYGYTIAIIDQDAEGLTPAEAAVRAMALEPRLVVIVVSGHQPSASTQTMPAALAVASALPKSIASILVGDHPSALPARTLEESSATYACDGEGPLTISGLLSKQLPEMIPGLVWRDIGGAIHRNELAPLIPVDQLHGDVWDLLPMEKYRAHNWQVMDGSPRQPYASIYTSLGCPFQCSFCMINVFQHTNKYRCRDPLKVVAQVDHLYRRYGVRTFKFADEMFVLNPKHYLAICEGLAALPYADELNIWAYARVDTVKAGNLPLLRQAGIRWLALGIESGSEHVRDGADKSFGQDDIFEVVGAIQDAGISVIGNYIFGLPDDDMVSMRDTLDMAVALNCEYANFYSAMCYPGSRLYDETPEADRPKAWSAYSQHSRDTTPLPTATLTSADVLRFRDDAFHEYFSSSRYLDMIREKFGAVVVQDIERMSSHRLERVL